MWRTLLCVAFLVGLHGPLPTRAAPRQPAEIQQIIDVATRQFEHGDFRAALDGYWRAFEAVGVPTLGYMVGRCHQELGEWGAAKERFVAFLATPDLPAQTRAKAEEALAAVHARLATGQLELRVTPEGAEVRVDGKRVGRAPLPTLALEPGRHEVRATAEGHDDGAAVVDVPGDGVAVAALALVPRPPPEPPLHSGGRALSADEQLVVVGQESPAPRYTALGWSLLGSGVALAAGGTAAYVLGEQDHDAVRGADGQSGGAVGMTRARALALEESGNQKRIAGYALWGVGGAAAVTGTVLLLLDATSSGPSRDHASAFGIVPTAGGGLLAVEGRF